MFSLSNKVAIVTGASSGIGHAAARQLARAGARVVVSARRQARLNELVELISAEGGQALAVAGDARDEDLARRLVDAAVERFGGLDIAFNNVGIAGATGPVAEMTLPGWHETIGVNLTSAFLSAKYQVPAMIARGGGSIVFTSSFVGHTVGMPGMCAYAASKAGLIGLTYALAAELGTQGIRVNAILPGGTDTPSNLVNQPDAGPGVRSFVENLHALKRLASPDEIASVVVHLASGAASFMTGAAIPVDGGVSISRT